VGADRRGPLAAFVVVALIAAILLVTSVRSQAAPWFSTRIVAGPATEPHLWGSVTGGMHQVVLDGAVLVRRAAHAPADAPTHTDALSASTSVVTPRHQSVATTPETRRPPSAHKAEHHRPANDGVTDRPGDTPTAPSTPVIADPGSPPGNPAHGVHLGWYRHHGQAQSESSPDSGEAFDPPDADEGAEHENGHGHANGRH
jgi:hypothetical protein